MPSIGRIVHFRNGHSNRCEASIVVNTDDNGLWLTVFSPDGRVETVRNVSHDPAFSTHGTWHEYTDHPVLTAVTNMPNEPVMIIPPNATTTSPNTDATINFGQTLSLLPPEPGS